MAKNRVIDTINKFINEKGVVILDGGFSNQLSTYNVDFEKSELWTSQVILTRPDLIKNVYLDYLKAGSDIITTVTYQATFQKLKIFGYTNEEIYKLFELAIKLAEQAIDEFMIDYEKKNGKIKKIRPLVAISVGPYGAYMCDGSEYRGIYNLNENDLVQFHRERIHLIATKLLNSKHLIAIETVPSLLEAKALIKLIKQYDNLNAWISFTIKQGTECISDGTPIEELIELVRNVKQIFAIGVNCVPPESVEPILKKLKQSSTNKLVLIYPNNGDLYDGVNRTFIANSAKFNYIDKVLEWKNNYNLSMIGGCCRIGPNDINRIRSFFTQL